MTPFPEPEEAAEMFARLEERDRDIARMLAREYRIDAIARHVHLSPQGVCNRLQRRIRPELGVNTNIGVATMTALAEVGQ